MIKVGMFAVVLIFYALFILPVFYFLLLLGVYTISVVRFSGPLQGQTVHWRFLQLDKIQNCFIITKGKISKVNYSPFGFSLKILGVF